MSGTFISRYTFSEAQAGKAACDRMTSAKKRVLEAYVNSGHNVETVGDMMEAFQTAERLGIAPKNVELYIMEIDRHLQERKPEFKAISSYNDFQFSRDSDDITAWQHHGIGQGLKLRFARVLNEREKYDETQWTIKHTLKIDGPSTDDDGEDDYVVRIGDGITISDDEELMENDEQDDDDDDERYNEIAQKVRFECTISGCYRHFAKEYQLRKHMMKDKHTTDENSRTMMDELSYNFVTMGESLRSDLHEVRAAVKEMMSKPSIHPQPSMGYAIKKNAPPVRISPRVKHLLTEMFNHGRQTKRKLTPADAIDRIMTDRFENGVLKFKREERIESKYVVRFSEYLVKIHQY